MRRELKVNSTSEIADGFLNRNLMRRELKVNSDTPSQRSRRTESHEERIESLEVEAELAEEL